MPKELIILCDGTGQSPENHLITNVQILKQLLLGFENFEKKYENNLNEGWESWTFFTEDKVKRVVYYDRGLGAPTLNLDGTKITVNWENPVNTIFDLIKSKFNEFEDQVFAKHIMSKVINAYYFLTKNYDKDDKIFIFGFSRGAYILRILISLLRQISLVDTKFYTEEEYKKIIEKGITLYNLQVRPRNNEKIKKFCEPYKFHPYKGLITFLGLWDTVRGTLISRGSVLRSLFPTLEYIAEPEIRLDSKLASVVQTGRHALAIDEKRVAFKPELWIPSKKTNSQQKWFPGSHSDIGGGYEDRSTLSNRTLVWIIEEAQKKGLTINISELKKYSSSDLLNLNPIGLQHDSLSDIKIKIVEGDSVAKKDFTWKDLGIYRRPIGQMVYCEDPEQTSEELLDSSVFERYGKTVDISFGDSVKQELYTPSNLTHMLIAFNNAHNRGVSELESKILALTNASKYDLLLMSELLKSGGKPEKGKLYLAKDGKKLKYTVIAPNNEIANGVVDISVEEELTSDKLSTLKFKILKETCKKGHTIKRVIPKGDDLSDVEDSTSLLYRPLKKAKL